MNIKKSLGLAGFSLVQIVLFAFLAISLSPQMGVFAGMGNNATTVTYLQVGNSFPEIINISLFGGARSIDLVANSTRAVSITVIARDYNGDNTIQNVSVRFYDSAVSSREDTDNNNYHYTNDSCNLDLSYGDIYDLNATCTVFPWYYANNATTWKFDVFVNDTTGLYEYRNLSMTMNALLSVGAPDSIDYGTINVTAISMEKIANVSNLGNIRLNLSLRGYAVSAYDNLSMNCTWGSVQNISIGYQKYNVSASNPGEILDLAQFETNYTNLTSLDVVRKFDLQKRTDEATNEAVNATYWRIYVPKGVGGSCSGNIIFGARRSAGS